MAIWKELVSVRNYQKLKIDVHGFWLIFINKRKTHKTQKKNFKDKSVRVFSGGLDTVWGQVARVKFWREGGSEFYICCL